MSCTDEGTLRGPPPTRANGMGGTFIKYREANGNSSPLASLLFPEPGTRLSGGLER